MKTRKRAAAAAEQQQICRFREKCKVVSGDNQLQFCDNHYNFHIDFLRNNPSILKKHQQLGLLGTEIPDLKLKKRKVKNPSSIPPDEERCCRIGGGRWRCRNFRMETKNYCEQHYRSISQHSKDLCMKKKKKKTGAGSSKRVTATRDSNRSKRPAKRQPTDKPSTSNNPTTSSDAIVGDGSIKIGAKRKRVERISGGLEPLTGIGGPVVETRASKRRKMVMECGETSNQPAAKDNFESDGIRGPVVTRSSKRRRMLMGCDETSNQLVTNDNFESDGIVEGSPPKIGTEGFGEPVNDQLESVELYKSNCFELSTEPEKVTAEKNDVELPKNEIELEKNKVELEKNKVNLEKMKPQFDKKKLECTEFQDKFAELEETKKSTSTDENTTEFWRMECSNAEILDQRMEDENSTIGCVETDISNLVSLVPGNGKESSLLRCQELSYSEKVESEAIGEWSKDSRADELKNEEKVLNVEEGRGCSEERPSQHGSSSQPDLEMCSKTSFNLVSDSNGGDDRLGTEDSLRDSMDMIVPGNGNESLILRCQELDYSEKVESEEHGLQNEIIETGENQRDEDMSKPSAEAIGERSKDSRAHEVKTEENALYVEEGKGLGCLEERPGSSSEADLEMCNKTSFNLVSDSNGGDDSLGAEDSLGDSMDMLVPGNGNESSILKSEELSYSEKVDSEAQGLNNKIFETGEIQRDEDMSKLNAEAIGEGSKDSRADELKTEEKVLSVEEGKGWGCSEERPSQHGSSQPDLEMCNNISFNLVSDSNDGDDSLGAEDSLRDPMDMLVPDNGNESSILGCQELSYSEKIESEAQGLQNEIIETGENQRDEDMSKLSAEAIGEGSKDSRAHEVKTEENALNVEEGKGLGCLEERPGSSSEADPEMCNKTSFNLVSDSNGGDDSLGAEDFLGDSMDMLVPGNGNESQILKCQELSYSEKVESEAQGLHNKIIETGEIQRDEDMSKPSAEAIGEGNKDSRARELKTEEKVLNVEEGKGLGCLEGKPSQHGSSSEADLEMCNKTSFNLVSESNGGDDSVGAEDSLRDSMDMLVPGNGNESLILRCQELSYSEKIESAAQGLQNEIIQTGENQREKEMSKPNAEAIGEGSKDSCAHELKTEEKVLNVEEGKGLGCLEEKPSQHGSSSEADLETCKKVSLNLVSASNDCGDSLGTEDSLGDSMNMMAMKNLNMNKDKMTEDDMLFSVEDCMKAVGALYQQETSKD